MALLMRYNPKKGGHDAAITCDHCGGDVDHGEWCTVYWPHAEQAPSVPRFIHKTCHREFDLANAADAWPTQELSHFLAELVHSVKLNNQRFRDRIDDSRPRPVEDPDDDEM